LENLSELRRLVQWPELVSEGPAPLSDRTAPK